MQPSYLSGAFVRVVQTDALGHVYVAGTQAAQTALPQAVRFGPAGADSLFLVKLNAAMDEVLFSAVIGGTTGGGPSVVTVDETGKIFVAGHTRSPAFPFTGRVLGSAQDPESGFVLKLNPSTGTLDFAVSLIPDPAAGDGATAGDVVDSAGNMWGREPPY